jgi:polysaccharide export outer membrane protein
MDFTKRFRASFSLRKFVPALTIALALSGCANLPSSGPTGGEIVKSAHAAGNGTGIKIVEVADFGALPTAPVAEGTAFPDLSPPPTDLVGPGDVLDIAIYETGVTLFGNSVRPGGDAGTFDPSAKAEKLPPSRVDDDGFIQLPYAGRLHVAGHTVGDIETMIRRSLTGLSQNPQVLVTMREVINNSVIIGGEVGRPGRLVLPTNRETISDAVALAGGYRGEAKDVSIRVQRRDTTVEFRLSDVLNGAARNMRVYPGDRITLVRAPRTFAVMGAPGRVEQMPFSNSSMSLAEAIAQAGGANPNLGDPEAIFVFRFVPDENGHDQPVVYHLNMMNAGSYFISQRFAMRDKDVLYIGNAKSNQPAKLIQIIGQLFTPLVMVTAVANGVGATP